MIILYYQVSACAISYHSWSHQRNSIVPTAYCPERYYYCHYTMYGGTYIHKLQTIKIVTFFIFSFFFLSTLRNHLQEYMLGNKKQKVLPVAFSLMASFTSAILMYGLSAEIFYRSTQFSVVVIGYTLAIPVVAYVYLPVFFKLGNLSLYEVKRTYRRVGT